MSHGWTGVGVVVVPGRPDHPLPCPCSLRQHDTTHMYCNACNAVAAYGGDCQCVQRGRGCCRHVICASSTSPHLPTVFHRLYSIFLCPSPHILAETVLAQLVERSALTNTIGVRVTHNKCNRTVKGSIPLGGIFWNFFFFTRHQWAALCCVLLACVR